MNCARCGEVCGCQSEPPPTGAPASELENEAADSAWAADAASAAAEGGVQAGDGSGAAAETRPDAWRDELAARLNRYRSRRRMRPPRYPSLELRFDDLSSSASLSASAEGHSAPAAPEDIHPAFGPVSENALALDPANPASTEGIHQPSSDRISHDRVEGSGATSGAKIIEFPRFAWGPPPPPPDELADPVGVRPRILEVPETAPPAPALGGITIEVAEREVEKRPGIDFPLQGASLARRLLASAVDGLLVMLASAIFGFVFWKVAAIRPPRAQLVGLAAGIPVLLWFAYQYLLIVYSGRTPGLAAAGLELAHFDGRRAKRSLRRWRVLASYLSAASLAMGYVWVFLDEDLLCWHDRITHTYLAPRKRESSPVSTRSQE